MSILDFLTGGQNSAAKEALEKAQQAFSNIQTPTAAQLTLPELQQYVQAGILTPAEAKAVAQGPNAYNAINVDPSTMGAEQKALGELGAVATDKGMTPEMQAQLTAALDQTQTQEQGANASILDQMAQRGIPTSLMGTAAQLANAGNQAQTTNLAATQAAGQAEQNAINAMMSEGNLAGSMHGQQYSEAANKAAAENAINQWNAAATNTANLTNAGYQQQANAYNTENAQNVSNQNTGLGNQRTMYNAQVPETVFNNQMAKAGGQAGVYGQQANQATQAGNQMMGLIGAGVGAAGNAFAPGVGTLAANGMSQPTGWQNGPPPGANTGQYAPAGYADGAIVPGEPKIDGDSKRNDIVPAKLSPGEVVLPRSVTTHPQAPDMAKRFVAHLLKSKPAPVHPDDVHSVLEALTRRRNAAPNMVAANRG